MNPVGLEVVHRQFGTGQVESCDGKTIRVLFPNFGARAFVYPDAFDTFLRAGDPAFAGELAKAISQVKAERAEKFAERLKRFETVPAEKPVKKTAVRKPAARKAAPKKRAAKVAEEQ